MSDNVFRPTPDELREDAEYQRELRGLVIDETNVLVPRYSPEEISDLLRLGRKTLTAEEIGALLREDERNRAKDKDGKP